MSSQLGRDNRPRTFPGYHRQQKQSSVVGDRFVRTDTLISRLEQAPIQLRNMEEMGPSSSLFRASTFGTPSIADWTFAKPTKFSTTEWNRKLRWISRRLQQRVWMWQTLKLSTSTRLFGTSRADENRLPRYWTNLSLPRHSYQPFPSAWFLWWSILWTWYSSLLAYFLIDIPITRLISSLVRASRPHQYFLRAFSRKAECTWRTRQPQTLTTSNPHRSSFSNTLSISYTT